ncbi:MAG: CAF17-like 4Fe-4S cluster assembly/insertion protein YgfZ [Alphaproteobacteria bacterium]
MRKIARLTDRLVLSVSGPDAESFLQGLITNDIALTREGRPIYAALLTPQGKILFDFIIRRNGERFLIDCAAERAGELTKRLGFYRLRAKIEINAEPRLAVAASWQTDESDLPSAFADPRLDALGRRTIAPETVLTAVNATLSDYHVHRITLGVPDSADLPPDTIFALDAGLEELNGVSFQKGCFIGQEVTARMKHRSVARRRVLIAEASTDLPVPGTPLVAGEREIGTLATSQSGRGLALVRLDRLAEAETAGADVTANGARVALRRPNWLRM